MARKNEQEHITVSIKREDYQKLNDFKIHPSQPYWEVISKLIKSYSESNNSVTTEFKPLVSNTTSDS